MRWWHRRRVQRAAAEPLDRTERGIVLTYTDPVTGLANQRAAVAWVRAQGARHRGLALVMIRTQAVERVRAQLGDAAANRVLRHQAARLRASFGPTAMVARGQGGAFFVVLSGIDEADVAAAAQQVCGILAPQPTAAMILAPSTAARWLPAGKPASPGWIGATLALLDERSGARATKPQPCSSAKFDNGLPMHHLG